MKEHRRAVIVSEGGTGKTYLAVDIGRDYREQAGTVLVNVRGAVSENNIMERFCAALKVNPAQASDCRVAGFCPGGGSALNVRVSFFRFQAGVPRSSFFVASVVCPVVVVCC